jgi:hypothetical protein
MAKHFFFTNQSEIDFGIVVVKTSQKSVRALRRTEYRAQKWLNSSGVLIDFTLKDLRFNFHILSGGI